MKNIRKGSLLVHTHHGVMRVRGICKREGPDGVAPHAVMDQMTCNSNVPAEAGPLTLTIPVARIESAGIRRPADKDDINDALDLIGTLPTESEAPLWARRMKNYEERLKSEDVFGAAQVLRSLHHRQRIRNGALSQAEQAMKRRAHWMVVSETAAAQQCSLERAEQRVSAQLAALESQMT